MKQFKFLVAGLLLSACSAELPHESPFDALSPFEKQAKGRVTGTVRLEGESDHSQVTVQLQNAERTYSVDTDADGAVKLTGVVPGTYDLSIRTRYFQAISESVRVVLGEELQLGSRQLALNRAAVMGSALAERVANDTIVSTGGVAVFLSKTGSVRSAAVPGGSPRLQAMAENATTVTYTAISSPSGLFQFTEVPAGRYAVSVAGEEGTETKVAEVLVTGEGDMRLEDIVVRPLTGFFQIAGMANGVKSSLYTSTEAVTLELIANNAQTMKVAVSPDGSTTACEAALDTAAEEPFTSQREVLLSGNGRKLVCVQYIDLDGKHTPPVFGSILYDSAAPGNINVLPFTNNGYSQTLNVFANLLATDDVDGIETSGVASYTVADSAAGALTALKQVFQPTVQLNFAGPGKHTKYVRIFDAAGNASAALPVTVTVDLEAPDVADAYLASLDGTKIGAGAQISQRTLLLVSDVSDALTPIDQLEMQVSVNGIVGSWIPYQASFAIDLPPAANPAGELRSVHANVRDAAGHVATLLSGVTVNLDNQAPKATFTLTSPSPTNNLTVAYTVASSEPGEMQVSADVGFTGASWEPVGAGTIVLAPGDGIRTLYARTRDAAGNESPIISRSINLDTAKPSPVAIVINGGAASTSAPDGVVNLSMTAADMGSGIDKMRIANSLAGLASATEEPYNGSKVWALANYGPGIEGVQTVWFQVSDRAGNYSDPASDSILYDTLPPQLSSIQVLTPQPSASRTADLRLAVTGATEMILGHDTVFTNRAWEPYNEFRTWTFAQGGNGDKRTVYVKFRDAAGNTTPEYTAEFEIDDVAPQAPAISVTGGMEQLDPASEYSRDLEFHIAALSASGGWARAEIASDVGFTNILKTIEFGETLPQSATLTSAIDGLVPVYVRFIDAVGNTSATASDSFTLDRTGPIITRVLVNGHDITDLSALAPVTAASGLASIAVEASDIGGGLDEIDILEGEGGRVNKTSFFPQPKSLQLANLMEQGVRPLQILVTDKAGNLAQWNHDMAFDYQTSGVETWTMLVKDREGNTSFTTSRDILVHINPTRPMKKYMISENAGFVGASWVTVNNPSALPQDLPYRLSSGGNDVEKTVYAKFMDDYGLVSTAQFDTIYIDDEAPSVPEVDVTPTYYVGATQEVQFTHIFEVGSDRIRVSSNPTMTPFQEYASVQAQPFHYMIGGSGDGPRKLYFQAFDPRGNPSEIFVWDYFSDLQPPQLTSALINGGATLTNHTTMTLSVSAEDYIPGSGLAKIRISADSSCPAFSMTTVELPYAPTVTFTHWNSSSGTYDMYICVVDVAGNVSSGLFQSIQVDVDPPVWNTFEVNDPNGVVNSQSVSLTAMSFDGGIEVQIANEPTFAGAAWQPIGNNVAWVLTTGDGTKNIYARFRDAAGNVSSSYLAQVNLDTTSPNPPALQVIDVTGDGFALANDSVELQWSVPTGTQEFELQRFVSGIDSDFVTIATPGGADSTYIDNLADGGKRHQYRIRARDGVHNWSAWSNIAEASPFEPILGAAWVRNADHFEFAVNPNTGTFTLSPTYLYETVWGAEKTETLPQNITRWVRPFPQESFFDETLNYRTTNQDSSLVYDSRVPLGFGSRDLLESSFGGTQVALDSKGHAHICYTTTSYDLGYATNRSGSWTYEIFKEIDFPNCSIAVDSKDNVMIVTEDRVNSSTHDSDLVLFTNSGEILRDDFEGPLGNRNWSYVSPGVERNTLGINVPSGSYALNLDGGGDIIESVELSGYTNLTYSYYFQRKGGGEAPDVGDNLYFEADNGSTWEVINIHAGNGTGDPGFTRVEGNLPAGTRKVRFRTVGSGEGVDDFFVDNFRVRTTPGTWISQWFDIGPAHVRRASMAIDANDKIHVAYYDVTNADLKYANNVLDDWSLTIVDSAGNVGNAPSLALDSNGRPGIAYLDVTNSDLKYAYYSGASWGFSVIDATFTSSFLALDFDRNNQAHVAYYQSNQLKYNKQVAGVWGGAINVMAGTFGKVALTMDAEGFAHISAYQTGSEDLIYLSNRTGSWESATVDTLGNVGDASSIVLDSEGRVHLSYRDSSQDLLKYAVFVPTDWTPWATSVVDAGGNAGRYASVATGVNGATHVAYVRDQNLYYATNAGGAWTTTLVDGTVNISYVSLALSSSGTAYIAYFNSSNSDLKFATNETGSWALSTLESTGNVGTYPSIALDAAGNIYIAYHNSSQNQARFIWRNAAKNWSTPVNLGSSYGYMSMAIDTTGTLHIVFANTSYRPQYIHGTPGSWSAQVAPTMVSSLERTAIAIDRNGKVHLASKGNWPNRLEYITNKSGNWVTEVVQTGADAGTAPRIVVDAQGAAHIFHQRAGNLSYATNQAGFWQTAVIDENGINGAFSSAAIDALGRLHVMYYDESNTSLKYTYGYFSGWLPAESVERSHPF